MEICNTGAMKPTPGFFNLYVVLVGHGLITDADKATTCMCKFKAPIIFSNCTKNEGHSENMVLNGKTFRKFRRIEVESVLSTLQKTRHQRGTRTPKTTNLKLPLHTVRIKLNLT